MKIKLCLIALVLLVACMFLVCDKDEHYDIQGRVIDAMTHQPVEGAVVAIKWERYKWVIPLFLSERARDYGTSEWVTDAQGRFVLQKYPHGTFFMGVYKEGYVCWGSKKIYHPEGKTYEEKYVRRWWFTVKDGMTIELQPITGNDFPVLEHARFVSIVNDLVEGRKFADITLGLRKVEREDYLKRTKK
jgi:hypothetical protein